MAKILIIEDDLKTAHAICKGLEADDYETTATHSGEQGLRLASRVAARPWRYLHAL